MKTLYLAGPINGCTDDEARGWREQVKHALGRPICEHGINALVCGCRGWGEELPDYYFIDPMDRDYRGKECGHAQDIVNADIADILRCDAVLVMAERPSWGTAMELVYARMLGKPVFAIYSGYTPSPWLEYHTITRFATIEQACLWFREQKIGAKPTPTRLRHARPLPEKGPPAAIPPE